MKKIVAIFLTLIMLACFAACDEKTENPSATPTTEPTGTSAATEAPTEAPTEEVKAPTEAATPHVEHVWGSWEAVEYALVGKNGTQKRVCADCGQTETAERTVNAIHNSFYDNGLQYVFMVGGGAIGSGRINASAMLEYACHEFHGIIENETTAEDIFTELAKHFVLTDDLKAEIRLIGKDQADWFENNAPDSDSPYGYNKAKDTFTLRYNAESGSVELLGYACTEENKYTVYYAYHNELTLEGEPILGKLELEYNKLEGKPNRYLSFTVIGELPSDMVKCSEGEFSEYHRDSLLS